MSLRNKVIEKTLPKAGKELGWASYTWSPITKSREGKLVFHEDRLRLPMAMKGKPRLSIWDNFVLVCPEIDLFSEEINTDWLYAIEKAMWDTSFTYMVVTEKPEMIIHSPIDWIWGFGVRISNQFELARALKVMVELPIEYKPAFIFLVFESLKNEYRIPRTLKGNSSLNYVDWFVIRRGAAGKDDWRNVETLLHHAREAGCGVYFEPGLNIKPIDPPWPLVYPRGRSFDDKLKEDDFCNRIKAFEEEEKENEEWSKNLDLIYNQPNDDFSDDVLIDDVEGVF